MVRGHSVEPGDAVRYARAAQHRVDQLAHRLDADRPVWLEQLVGRRPADVAGATTWDDAVRQIVHWRALRELPADIEGLGGRPDTGEGVVAWEDLHGRLASARAWIAGTNRFYPADAVTPSRGELLDRRDALDVLLATAPPDWRVTINRLQHGQLTLDDTTELLQAARTGQQERRDWILRNWPHVVEYLEINRTLTTGTWGPDPALLTDLRTRPLGTALADAIDRQEPWLRVALNRLADGDTAQLDGSAVEQLERLASYRADYGLAPSASCDLHWWHPIDEVDAWSDEPTVDVSGIEL
jgi:hypothetical protein